MARNLNFFFIEIRLTYNGFYSKGNGRLRILNRAKIWFSCSQGAPGPTREKGCRRWSEHKETSEEAATIVKTWVDRTKILEQRAVSQGQ